MVVTQWKECPSPGSDGKGTYSPRDTLMESNPSKVMRPQRPSSVVKWIAVIAPPYCTIGESTESAVKGTAKPWATCLDFGMVSGCAIIGLAEVYKLGSRKCDCGAAGRASDRDPGCMT